MKKILVAALLAATAMPTSAATYIRYTGTGVGNGTTIAQGTGVTLQTGPGTFQVEIVAIISDGLSGCQGVPQKGCGLDGNNITGSVNIPGTALGSVTLTFDGPLADWPITADHFVSGTAGGTFGGMTTSTHWSGTVSSLSVELFELSTTRGFTGTTMSFGFTSSDAVPEPASWALMIGGFAIAGAALRGRTRVRFA